MGCACDPKTTISIVNNEGKTVLFKQGGNMKNAWGMGFLDILNPKAS